VIPIATDSDDQPDGGAPGRRGDELLAALRTETWPLLTDGAPISKAEREQALGRGLNTTIGDVSGLAAPAAYHWPPHLARVSTRSRCFAARQAIQPLELISGVVEQGTVRRRRHGDSKWASGGRYTLDGYLGDRHAVVAALDRPPLLGGGAARKQRARRGGNLPALAPAPRGWTSHSMPTRRAETR
jgi:hypothetical protein